MKATNKALYRFRPVKETTTTLAKCGVVRTFRYPKLERYYELLHRHALTGTELTIKETVKA